VEHPRLVRDAFGRRFRNPILLAAGTAGFGIELAGVMDLGRIGGVITKSVSLEPRGGNPPPRVAEFHGGMLNSVGLANPGVDQACRVEIPDMVALLGDTAVIVSVVGFDMDEYAEVVGRLDTVDGIAAYELNLSCPNTARGGIEFGAEPSSVSEIVSHVRAATHRPVIAKLSPILPDVVEVAGAAKEAGADGVALVNTIPGWLYDGTTKTRLGAGRGGVSGPGLLPIGVRATREVAQHLPGLPIIGVGGVGSAEDAWQYLTAGATLVGIGTAALADPRLPERVVRNMTEVGSG
jgi:dihydroorotate dehydrogenase (NAD+) catalytic subunit